MLHSIQGQLVEFCFYEGEEMQIREKIVPLKIDPSGRLHGGGGIPVSGRPAAHLNVLARYREGTTLLLGLSPLPLTASALVLALVDLDGESTEEVWWRCEDSDGFILGTAATTAAVPMATMVADLTVGLDGESMEEARRGVGTAIVLLINAIAFTATAVALGLMPGGGSHLAAGGMKYGVSQYKPVPAGSPSGYGNYTHPAGFTMGSPGVIGGAVGVDDVNRIKYKDNNLYAPSPQVETSDIWIQTPREMPTLQCPPYFNLSGQATSGAFVPNPGNASFNATAQSSHAQFPGLYHPQQPSSIVSPHPMVHQQVPSAIGPSVGVGVATPAPQVGAYQQPQLGHWRPGF
ncbi:hypothetical protein E2562_001569 [Oryza meyeriana var. granulata]|uniref:Uncharacterized protein n=1 Tax=Oryza meyeriana var. granulata TaxID=110450 RepID=A0A6G1CCH1_9ORYZ|nr:hypothetical protein E2562_001569 [Oryza meyeriana var. granulata]